MPVSVQGMDQALLCAVQQQDSRQELIPGRFHLTMRNLLSCAQAPLRLLRKVWSLVTGDISESSGHNPVLCALR